MCGSEQTECQRCRKLQGRSWPHGQPDISKAPEVAMNFAAWIVAGIIIGWLANRMMNDGAQDGRLGYLAVGVLGAFAGVQLLAPMFGPPAADPNAFSMTLLISSAIGASVCLIAGTMIRRKFFP
jgi:uncharacterized membrane protein YeaQ/YmgE (transglycosylase-associated protein family)